VQCVKKIFFSCIQDYFTWNTTAIRWCGGSHMPVISGMWLEQQKQFSPYQHLLRQLSAFSVQLGFGNIFRPERTRLTEEKFAQLVFIKCNKRITESYCHA